MGAHAPSAALAGFAFASGAVVWDTAIQRTIAPEKLARVSAYGWMGAMVFLPAGYALAGPIASVVGMRAYLLFGASDFTGRLVPALFGVALIGMPYFLRHELGKAGAIAASALLVISPAFLYFSRFIRHDIYVDVFTLLMVIGVFRYLASGKRSWFYVTCVAMTWWYYMRRSFMTQVAPTLAQARI